MHACDLDIPEYFQCVSLLARGTSGRPDLGVTPFALGSRSDVGQHVAAHDFEYAPVAKEPRNRDVAALVKDLPFRRVGFEPRAISRITIQAESAHPLLQALAHLTPHFPEPRPAQLALWQCPLQEGCAIRIVHDVPALVES